MLGEDHSLVKEFPTKQAKIAELNETDQAFAAKAKRYHLLDEEIRNLELENAPIDDDALHQMKRERAELKDVLYQAIIA